MIAYLVAYDGSLFYGFTGHERSVEPALARALGPLLGRGSRTDPGVSALGNVVVARSLKPLGQINAELPRGVWVWGYAEVPEGFNPRRARARTYVYFAPYRGEDLGLVREAASLFVGTHDYRNFAKGVRDAVTTIYSIEVEDRGAYIEIAFRGKGFRNKMLRKIVWALLAVGRGVLGIDDVRRLLESGGGGPVPSAPAEGLVLLSIDYGIEFSADRAILTKIYRYFLNKYYIYLSLSRVYEKITEEILKWL
ncbi:Pseudouridylate synthase [Thermoproteus uzoniensis 768-20]|uniref:tRNA pseudouridine synthase A n=1 Tax=Thermoproteus uzoniensis (strain 768-20) TaxID=999630 RepID=F2L0Q5_THEU7|nr:Pseudouridylate synthase [Thermoproteus uzoniensis 768-20]